MGKPGYGSSRLQFIRWSFLPLILWILFVVDETSADCSPYQDEIVELQANGTSTLLTTPGYPKKTLPLDCVAKWRITSDSDSVMFVIPRIGSSCDNSLILYDGYSSNGTIFPLCDRIEEFGSGTSYATHSKYLFIVLTSNSSHLATGFRMSYEAQDACECNGNVKYLEAGETSKKVTSPQHSKAFPNNCMCQWLIHSNADIIQFNIRSFPVYYNDHNSQNCIEFHYGSTSMNSTIEKVCSFSYRIGTVPIYTTTKDSLVVFKSDSFQPFPTGFSFSYRARDWDPRCSHDVTTLQATHSTKVVHLSPDQDGLLPPSKCRWIITSDDTYLKLKINVYSSRYGCYNDSYVVYEGSASSGREINGWSCEDGFFPVFTLKYHGKINILVQLESNGGLSEFNMSYTTSSVAKPLGAYSVWITSVIYVSVWMMGLLPGDRFPCLVSWTG